MGAIKRTIEKEDLSPIVHFKTIYKRLRHNGELAIKDILSTFQNIANKETDPLGPITDLQPDTGRIFFKFIGLDCYVQVYFSLSDSCGFIEWGTYVKDSDGGYKPFEHHKDKYDLNGSINDDMTHAEFAHVLIPNAFNKILNSAYIFL